MCVCVCVGGGGGVLRAPLDLSSHVYQVYLNNKIILIPFFNEILFNGINNTFPMLTTLNNLNLLIVGTH